MDVHLDFHTAPELCQPLQLLPWPVVELGLQGESPLAKADDVEPHVLGCRLTY